MVPSIRTKSTMCNCGYDVLFLTCCVVPHVWGLRPFVLFSPKSWGPSECLCGVFVLLVSTVCRTALPRMPITEGSEACSSLDVALGSL